ncbi:MAG TPA: ABC transporter ATP-binding protein [Lacisediminihabitans sp.]|uniref:ABC transporter ATP-binding protein n=1 Tax=Lacisediminihabitans sp. TaxID=2787631 RepID=UPI002ED932F7
MSSPERASAVEVRGLSVDYSGTRALHEISLSVATGGSLGIIGESGSGKTTLLYSIARLLPANANIVSGSVLFGGEDLLAMSEERMRQLRWREISIVFQGAMHALNPVIRVGSLLREVLVQRSHLGSRAEIDRRIDEALAMVDVPRRVIRAYPHELSGGMRQRVIIAMSLLCEPTLLLADEPTTSLDVIVQAEILGRLAELRRRLGFTFVFVSHDLGVVSQYCDDVAVMYDGRIVEFGPVREVLTAPQHPHTRRLIRSYPSIDATLDLRALAATDVDEAVIANEEDHG